jgi:hypothetical protein
MNHRLWSSVAARVIAVTFVLAGVAACDRKDVTTHSAEMSPSAQVIGVEPAPPTGDPPGTTPVAASQEVSKAVESNSMPLPGQPNDHSNEARKPSQNAETQEVLTSTSQAKTANGGPSHSETKGDAK